MVRSEPHSGVGREREWVAGITFLYAKEEDFRKVQDFVFNRLRQGDRSGAHLPLEKRRIPFHEPVIVSYEKFEEFVEEVSENLSLNGMFIRSANPKRPGSTLSFEFRLGEDMPLIQGRAEVAWRRMTTDAPDRPAGMGIRFLKIDMRSRDLIKRLVKEHTLRKAQAEGPGLETPTPKREARAAVVTPRRSKTPIVLGVLAIAILFALLIALSLPRRSAPPTVERSPATEIGAVAELEPPTRASVVEEPEPQAGPADDEAAEPALGLPEAREAVETTTLEPESPSPVEETPTGAAETTALAADGNVDLSKVEATVLAWAEAWSAQRVDDYLAFYAEEFTPPDGLSRPAWAEQRTSRLRRPDWIKVEVDGMSQQPTGPDRVRVTFSQAYSSDSFSDSVTKTLELIWVEAAWKISSETSS